MGLLGGAIEIALTFHFFVLLFLLEDLNVVLQLQVVGFGLPGLKGKVMLWGNGIKLTDFWSSESCFHSPPMILEMSVSEVPKVINK